MRKMASKEGRKGLTGIVQLCFVWQTCTWGMLETLSACDQRNEAIKYVNKIRARAGIPGYEHGRGTTDDNGLHAFPMKIHDGGQTYSSLNVWLS